MQKQPIKAGFFEPGLIEASRFARFEPYQKTEFCLLAAEAGIAVPSIAEMMRVKSDDVQSAMERRHLHNPFRTVGERHPAAEPVRRTVAKDAYVAILAYIAGGRNGSVTISLMNLSRATGVRKSTAESALRRMQERGHVELARRGDRGQPSTYRMMEKGVSALAKLRESA